jgi:hypothetical protein
MNEVFPQFEGRSFALLKAAKEILESRSHPLADKARIQRALTDQTEERKIFNALRRRREKDAPDRFEIFMVLCYEHTHPLAPAPFRHLSYSKIVSVLTDLGVSATRERVRNFIRKHRLPRDQQ